MDRLKLKSRVGPDGVLSVNIHMSAADANQEVVVTVEPAMAERPHFASQEEWRQWIDGVAGSITDPTFRRHDQGQVGERTQL